VKFILPQRSQRTPREEEERKEEEEEPVRSCKKIDKACAGPPGLNGWGWPTPGFADPSGELQPGLLREQALRAVCGSFC